MSLCQAGLLLRNLKGILGYEIGFRVQGCYPPKMENQNKMETGVIWGLRNSIVVT